MLSVIGSLSRSTMAWPQKQHWESARLDALVMRDKLLPSNGSRLSCGAKAGQRKRPVLRYVRAGAQTKRNASFKNRRRQLQALVRRHAYSIGARSEGLGSELGVARPSIDQTSMPASLPAFAKAKAPKRRPCSSCHL